MKRFVDIVGSLIGLVVFIPVLLILAILIRQKMGAPVLYRAVRPGKGGALFGMIKFRSMNNDRDAAGDLLPDAARLTAFGRLLRRTSLDELPELWNVLKGDMSLVGPRPLLPEYLPLYSAEQARRHDVRPGITGCAQVNGRNAISWEEKFVLDVWYVENLGFWLDLRIIWMTVKKVIVKDGISAGGEATMPRFTGSKPEGEP